MSSPLASVAVINAMIFGVYGNVQRRLNNPDSLRSHALAGSIAGLVQSFVCSPMELVKTRLQIQEQVCANGAQLYKYTVNFKIKIYIIYLILIIFKRPSGLPSSDLAQGRGSRNLSRTHHYNISRNPRIRPLFFEL